MSPTIPVQTLRLKRTLHPNWREPLRSSPTQRLTVADTENTLTCTRRFVCPRHSLQADLIRSMLMW